MLIAYASHTQINETTTERQVDGGILTYLN